MSRNGILLPVSSLPSNYGVGDFGPNAKQFILWLEERNFSYWQILPINPLGPGWSPYMTTCSEALDPRFISLDELIKDKLLDKVPVYAKDNQYCDFYNAYLFKEKYLRKAFARFKKEKRPGLDKFVKANKWVVAYATFIILDKKNEQRPWNTWCEEEKNYFKYNTSYPKAYKKEAEFIIFCQYIAYKQWKSVLRFAHRHNIKVIGDLPFYVGYSSVDCWINRDYFDLDENYNPRTVAGCPPDGFSAEGQLWGNPCYNFPKMKKNNFKFLINRLGAIGKVCDIIRLDHFRAFEKYYAIPGGAVNAVIGEWRDGPAYDFFDAFFKKYKNIDIIAEDLGFMTQSVYDLRDHYNLPGMNVAQFTCMDHNWVNKDNMIVYTGTHDNETTRGWIDHLSWDERCHLAWILGKDPHEDLLEAFIARTYNLPGKMVIIPMMDYLRLGNEARLNTPSTLGSPNWEWKLIEFPR